MNLLAGFLILICLVGSELNGFQVADDVGERLLAVILTALLVPGSAFFQTAVLIRKIRSQPFSYEKKQSLCRRMTTSHAAVWLSASLAIIWALRWQDVVRGSWNLDPWPLVDEFLILTPIVLSMVASWFVFYELQVALLADDAPEVDVLDLRATKQDLRNQFQAWVKNVPTSIGPRIEFVSIRFRLYFLLVLIPIGVFILARDLLSIISALPEPVSMALYGIGLVAMTLGFPLLILFVWKTAPISDLELRANLMEICQQNRLRVFDVRVWKTGSQIVNAVVAGLIPGFRVILLSDGLLQNFEKHEVEAVLRHEAGHIRLWHLPTRLFFMCVPLASLAISDSPTFGWELVAPTSVGWLGSAALLPLVVYAIYAWLMTRWLSHQMEFEADMYSIQSDRSISEKTPQQNRSLCHNRAHDMQDALLRLAAISPGEFERSTFFHPSIRQRIEFIERVTESSSAALQFEKAFARRRKILAVLVLIVCVAAVFLPGF